MTANTYAKVFCPRCGFSFNAEISSAGRNVGGAGGIAAGAALGAKIGIVAGPLGAIAGTIPGAILGGIFGAKAGNKLDRPQCPKCGQSFDMVKPSAPEEQQSLPSVFEELGSASNLVIELLDCKDEFEMTLQGTATISSLVKEAHTRFGLTVEKDSPISDFMIALRDQKFDAMTKLIKAMALTLKDMNSNFERGVTMCYFITGDDFSSQEPEQVEEHGFESFDEWLEEFKEGAGDTNEHLAASTDDGTCLVDLMDLAPLRRAFADGVEPYELGVEYGQQFDIGEFLARNHGASR